MSRRNVPPPSSGCFSVLHLLVTAKVVPSSLIACTLKIDARLISETSVLAEAKRVISQKTGFFKTVLVFFEVFCFKTA
jgi:hypothetical protein